MSVRDTSIEAYNELIRRGKHDGYKTRILEHLIKIYPEGATRLEMCVDLGITVNTLSGVVRPMLRDGWIDDSRKRSCRETCNIVYELKAIVKPQQELF